MLLLNLTSMVQALRSLALHIGDGAAEPTPLPGGCCPGNLAEVLEFLQVMFIEVPPCITCSLELGSPHNLLLQRCAMYSSFTGSCYSDECCSAVHSLRHQLRRCSPTWEV